MLASRALGAGGARILFKHMLLNMLGPIMPTLTLSVSAAIFTEAFLSLLGLGVQPPEGVSWHDHERCFRGLAVYPWRLLFPGMALGLMMYALHAIGDGLRDAFDPKFST